MKKLFLFLNFILFFSFSFSLKISEVYFDGRNEFIWIYNDKNTLFSWKIILSWAKSKNIEIFINIDSKQEIIVWDKSNILSWVNFYKTWLSLNISDSKSIDIDLLDNNKNILDNFFVSTWDVKNLDNKKTSFEKIYSWNKWIVQDVKTWINVNNWYFANPWYVYFLDNSEQNKQVDSSWNNLKIYNCNINLVSKSWNNYNFTYLSNFDLSWINWYINNSFIRTWQNMSINLSSWDDLIKAIWYDLSWNVCTWNYFLSFNKVNKNIFTWTLKINEIHSKKDYMNEFVELKSFWNISWDYIFSWFLSSSNTFSLHLTMYSWSIIVIADSYTWFLYTWNVLLRNLSLKDSWEILQIIKNGQVIDNVKYDLVPSWKESLYYSWEKWNVRIFNKINSYTPWYENYILNKNKVFEKTDCKIIVQSKEENNNQLKINFDTDIKDNKYCSKNYRQIWTYSWHILTWTCNPSYFYFNTWDNTVNFKIENLSWDNICEDNYNIFYLQKEEEKQKNLNCYIKIQSKTSSFLSKDSLNFITIVNDKEIQNSNSKYSCKYLLSWNILSENCNPSSLYLSWWLNIIDLEVMSNNWLTCQSKLYLNLPDENIKTNTKILNNIPTPSFCSKMNSNNLKSLVLLIKNKYKSLATFKKIFNPISYLYEKDNTNEYLKMNSKQLKELVDNIDKKYKSENTKRNIFSSVKYLFDKNIIKTWNIFTWFNLKIVKILPNPIWIDKNKEIIVLSWNYVSWLYLKTSKKTYLNKYFLSGSNLYFTWDFSMKNSFWCIDLWLWKNIVSRLCYNSVKEWQFISKFIDNRQNNVNLDISFSGENIILSNGQVFKNKKFINYKKFLKKRLKKAIKLIKSKFAQYRKQINKLKKENKKIRKINLERTVKYVLLKAKFNKFKNNYSIKFKNKSKKIKDKNLKIRQLLANIKNKNNIIYFMKGFIRKIKKYIDKDIYKTYLDNLYLVEKWKKIRY